MKEFHNPQNLTAEQFGGPDGFRLLTVEEAAILTDPLSARSTVGTQLVQKLAPEYYADNACRWRAHDYTGQHQRISETLTYRTLAPELVEMPPPPVNPEAFDAAAGDFVEAFDFLAAYHHEIMIDKGFWDGENAVDQFLRDNGRDDLAEIVKGAFDGQKIALQGSELSEALEGIRHGNGPDDKVPEFNAAEAEFADVLLRIMDHGHKRGFRVAAALVAKLQMNATRAKMHGGKRF